MEDIHTSPVPAKIMNTLRHTKSEENLAAEGAAQAESASLCAFSVYGNPDDETGDCWSQEDDEISQQVHSGYFSCFRILLLEILNLRSI